MDSEIKKRGGALYARRLKTGVSLDPSTLEAAIYALLEANNTETDAHCVRIPLPHR